MSAMDGNQDFRTGAQRGAHPAAAAGQPHAHPSASARRPVSSGGSGGSSNVCRNASSVVATEHSVVLTIRFGDHYELLAPSARAELLAKAVAVRSSKTIATHMSVSEVQVSTAKRPLVYADWHLRFVLTCLLVVNR
jgi:hypothetical protein